MQLTGRTVAVTGGTSGIGLGLVSELTRRGNAVITCGRDPARLARVRERFPGVAAVATDLATPEGVAHMADRIAERFEVLDVLVNNAGMSAGFDLDDPVTTSAQAAEIIAVNLTALVQLSTLCLPLLARAAEPAIVNVTSIVGHVPKGRAPVYSATKAAVRAFTVALRARLAETNIRVIDVLPPLVESSMPGPVGMKRMDPYEFAARVLDAIGRDRLDVRMGRNRWIVHASRVVPRVADRMIG